MPRRPLTAALLLLAACAGDGSDKNGETGAPDDSGDSGDSGEPVPSGCITVDGQGSYGRLADAIAAASPGSTVTLCAGSWSETVVIDKALTLEGPGMDETTLVAPTNEPAIEIAADGVTIRGVALESGRSGVKVDGWSDLRLVAVGLLAVDNYGIEATDAENLSIESCVFNATAYGGAYIEGGSASVSDSSFNDNTGFAILATDGASLVATGNTISGTAPTDPEEVADGHGIWLVGSEGSLSGNVLTDNFFVGIFADGSALTLDGDSVTGSLYGVAHLLEPLEASGVTLTDNYFYGLFAVSDQSVSVTGATVSGDRSAVVDVDSADWGDEDVGYLGVGLYLVAPTITVSQSAVTGYNNAGMLLSGYDDTGEAAISDITLTDNGRVGLYVLSENLTASNVTIQGLIEVEDAGDEQCITVGSNAAATFIQSSVSWEGGGVYSNDGYGLTSIYSALTVENATISDTSCGGVMNFGGSLVAQGNTFTASNGGGLEAGLVAYEGSSTTVVGNAFTDNQEWGLTSLSESEDSSGNVYRYEQYGYIGADIQLYLGGSNTIQGNTFVTGTDGVYAYESDATIEDNTWTDYRGVVLYAYSSSGHTVELDNATVDGFYSYAAGCAYGTLEVSDSSFANGGSYYYEFYAYLNDEPYYSYMSEYANPALYGYNCAMVAEDLDVSDLEGSILQGSGGTYEIMGLKGKNLSTGGSSGSDAIYFNSYSYYYLDSSSGTEYTSFYETEAWLTDVELEEVVAGNGVTAYEYVYGEGEDPDTLLHVDGLEVNGVSASALRLENGNTSFAGPEADLANVVITAAGQGIWANTSTLDLESVSISDVDGEGLTMDQVVLSASGLTVEGAGDDGMSFDEGELRLTGSAITACGGNGLALTSTTATVTENTITDNAGYGMTCSSVSFEECGNDLSGNTLGAQSGCDESCDASP